MEKDHILEKHQLSSNMKQPISQNEVNCLNNPITIEKTEFITLKPSPKELPKYR